MHGGRGLPSDYKKALGLSGNTGKEEEIPEECESCGDEVRTYVKYKDPKEKVYYCESCGNRHYATEDKAVGMDYV